MRGTSTMTPISEMIPMAVIVQKAERHSIDHVITSASTSHFNRNCFRERDARQVQTAVREASPTAVVRAHTSM
jgi:hypothetical protein